MSNSVKGYKVFNPDWTCRGKQYTCPGKFEEDVNPKVCERGMHFCKKLRDCFDYYGFDPKNKVAEVIAYGDVITKDDKSYTNKLEIVRELSWVEVLYMVNCGVGNTGRCNTGKYNTGYRNIGNYNTGGWNTGNYNGGDCNDGDYNCGDNNIGYHNSGDCNHGNSNSGNYNDGSWNCGSWNCGSWNCGYYNSGCHNSGDYNKCDYSNGCFNIASPKIYLFNKLSQWTYQDWLLSDARTLLKNMPKKSCSNAVRQKWWNMLSDYDKSAIKQLPNFDPEIFKKVTGIDVEEEK